MWRKATYIVNRDAHYGSTTVGTNTALQSRSKIPNHIETTIKFYIIPVAAVAGMGAVLNHSSKLYTQISRPHLNDR